MENPSISPEIEKKAADLVEDFDRFWNGRDSEALAGLFTAEADFQFHYGHLVRGREKIERYYRTKVFPFLEPGLSHITRGYRIREAAPGVLIGDGKVDLSLMDERGELIEVKHQVRVTTVVIQQGEELKFSAVRVMKPVKD